jgi:hypothetical protein
MMQALTNTPGVRFKAWIPIRENDPHGDVQTIPFDIAGERTVLVERTDEAGTFDNDKLTGDLQKVIQSLLDEED